MQLPHISSKMRQTTPSLLSSQKFNVTLSLDLSLTSHIWSVWAVKSTDGHDLTARVVVEEPSNNVPA